MNPPGNKPALLASDKRGKILELPSFEACGMKGGSFFRLSGRELVKLPRGSELFMLPDRIPVGYDASRRRFLTVRGHSAVAAFISPGYTVCYNSAYRQAGSPGPLPLFAYSAVALCRGEFYVPAVRVDREPRQDLRFMDIGAVKKNVKLYRKLYPKNRLLRHLTGCALTYGCPAAKNFFLGRYEAPLPTSPRCNAACAGCISHQPAKGCSVTQPRIKFIPGPEEIAEVALHHIRGVRDPVVSFGQGCEGEPLLAHRAIEDSIRLIRAKTSKGVINMNTNASRPSVIAKLFDAGLDSIRVSMNSARREYYTRYYRPKGYAYKDVVRSIAVAKKKKGFVSINYLTMPGFTDTEEEFAAVRKLIAVHSVDMIQWRNMNFDPVRYFKELRISCGNERMLGIKQVIRALHSEFPGLSMGYFNPSKNRIRRSIITGRRRLKRA